MEHFSDSQLVRIAIGQYLADAGINRATIADMTQRAINERVDKCLKTVIAQNVEGKVASIIRAELVEALRIAVRRETNAISVHVKYDRPKEEDESEPCKD